MRIVMISDNEVDGGAAIAASRLALGLVHQGHQVLRIVDRPAVHQQPWDTRVVSFKPKKSLWRRLTPKFLRRNKTLPITPDLYSRSDECVQKIVREFAPDIINFHNIHSARSWPLDLVEHCRQMAPVVWTLHDMWCMTGRCAYSYDCRRFIQGCNAECPTANEYPALPHSLIKPAWETRRSLSNRHPDIVLVAPSQWLGQEAKSGIWKQHRVEVIPYGLPLDIYKPLDRQDARRSLGVACQGPVFLAAAQSWDERRKGGHLMVEALRSITDRPLTLMILGKGKMPTLPANIQVIPLGRLDDPHTIAQAFNAADLLVHPAQVDNLPNVVLEALACGTPTVGFPIGGMPDMVRSGRSGWLARSLCAADLKSTLLQALADIQNGRTYRDECRKIAEQEYNENLQATRYIELFTSMLKI